LGSGLCCGRKHVADRDHLTARVLEVAGDVQIGDVAGAEHA
jgi:hypothetical protein